MNRGAPAPGVVMLALVSAGVAASLLFSVALPLMAIFPGVFAASPSSAAWIVVANTVAGAVATPVLGRMGDMWGPRRVLIGAMACMTAGSVVCALAPNLAVMVAGRVLQAASYGTVPLGIGLLRRLLPAERVALGVATLSATLGIGSGIGITVAGMLLAGSGWRSVFAAMAGLTALVTVALVVALPEDEPGSARRFDFWGAAGLGVTLSLLLVPVSKGTDWGWTSPGVIGMLAGGLLAAAAWAWHEWRSDHPLVDLRLASSRPVLGVNLISVAVGLCLFGSLLTVVTVIQAPSGTGYGLGRTELVAGLCLIPGNIAMLLAPLPATRIARAWGNRRLLRVGLLVVAAGYLFRSFADRDLSQVVAGYLFVQIGLAACMSGLPMAIVANTPRHETSSAQGLGSTMRIVGMSVGGAAYATITAASHVRAGADVFPSSAALALTFAIAIAGALAAAAATFLPSRSG